MNRHGFFRVSAVSPRVKVADVEYNKQQIINRMHDAAKQGVQLLVTPELSITGYTCGDLFRHTVLLETARDALAEIAEASGKLHVAVAVGLPVLRDSALYNCAALCADGEVKALVPKRHLPNYNEFYEKRWFKPGDFNLNKLVKIGDAVIGMEICEDLWVPNPPSTELCLAGANVIVNLSATNELIGKHDYLRNLISQQSARCQCAYVYASAGFGESSTDLVYAGNAIIAENGKLLQESERFTTGVKCAVADVDLELLGNDRRNSSFRDMAHGGTAEVVECKQPSQPDDDELLRFVDPHPFVPEKEEDLFTHCAEILNIQAFGLMQRLEVTGCKKVVVGISGGLDSTLALLVCVRAFDALGLDRKGIFGITMPGFGTTDRTHNNAWVLMEELGVTALEIPIGKAVKQHFEDIGQDGEVHDVTYENSQARERTQILMDYANKIGGMVIGTGDLSELALGWCTYNGDHMSMYAVNTSVPKTLVKHLVKYYAHEATDGALKRALLDIVDTPISPELVPADEKGEIAQKTEDLVGPYELHDFYLYHFLRHSFSPEKILLLAQKAFNGVYDDETLRHWLDVFHRRFFNQQFKRSCLPDGPKVGSVCLSPRGDWRMPSDASSSLWKLK